MLSLMDVFTIFFSAYIERCKKKDLHNLIQTTTTSPLWIKMLPALAFVPLPVVVNAFENLQQNLPVDADPISNYFEDHFIGRQRGRIRQPPRFPVDLWNIHDRLNLDLPKTIDVLYIPR